MQFVQKNSLIILSTLLFIALLGYGIWEDNAYISLIPFALLVLFVAVFYTEFTFFFILFATPLSINIEEYTNGLNTIKSLPSLSGLLSSGTSAPIVYMCMLLNRLCPSPYAPSFGPSIDAIPDTNTAGKCYYYWKGAPVSVQKDGLGENAAFDLTSYSQACFSTNLDVLYNLRFLAPLICPRLGAPVPGVPGCW